MGRRSDFDLDGFLPYRLTVAAERLSKALSQQYRDRFGISVAEWRVLVHLAHADTDAVSIRDLERCVSLEKSRLSRAASRLEAAGHISKAVNAEDRRLLQLSLNPQGKALMQKLVPLARRYQRALEDQIRPHLADLTAALDIFMEDTE
ncbi:MarR family winged helix-turn-helix transcriptional regulator [Halovulum sp. GXIMD14793]